MDNEMDSYLRQYQSQIYQGYPLITNHFQRHQQSESNFTFVHNPETMFNMTDQPSVVFNRPYQTISDEQLLPEQLREKLRKQLEYYFSRENLINDIYLQSQMDADNYVPISIIATFKLVKRLTEDLQLIIDVLKESPSVEVDGEEKKVRSSDDKAYLPTRKRCIIILRNVPLDATENEILGLFLNEYCSVSAIECERVLESDCWYVTFNNEDDAQNAFLYLTRENISIRGQKILARMKTRLWQKPLTSSNDGLTSQDPSLISTQEQYTPDYIQSLPTSHTNQASFRGNVPQTAINYRLQQHLPSTISSLSFARNNQQLNINFPPQTQFINRNRSVLPLNVWYIPPTMDSYPPMFVPLHSLIRNYNGANKSKTRITTYKPRNPTKSISNQQGFLIANNHSNELFNSYANTVVPSMSSGDSSSSAHRHETSFNHSNDTPIQTYSSSVNSSDSS